MKKKVWLVFGALVGVFVILVSGVTIPAFRVWLSLPLLAGLAISFFSLGLALVGLTLREKVEGKLKKFLLLTGGSAVGFFVSVVLHNLVYGLFIQLFGLTFWERIGSGDEPVFFFLAIVVCPIGFLVGAVGSVVCLVQRVKKR